MERYYPVAIVTLVYGLIVFGMALTVSRIHANTGIVAPTMTGDPRLERAFRAHLNTIEWTPVFLPSMWLFAIYWNASWAGRPRRTVADWPDSLFHWIHFRSQ
jgi:uncharacterized membrane protein YecN with MAPEG domain